MDLLLAVRQVKLHMHLAWGMLVWERSWRGTNLWL